MPMLRALPAMVRTAASRSAAVRSGSLVLAISSSWARVTLPTLLVCGSRDPFLMFAALRSSTEAGGVLVMQLELLSLNTVISQGMGKPGSTCWVWALTALQNSMILAPCWPSAGPTGGLGLAWPAGTWSFTYPLTFLAMLFSPRVQAPRHAGKRLPVCLKPGAHYPRARQIVESAARRLRAFPPA